MSIAEGVEQLALEYTRYAADIASRVMHQAPGDAVVLGGARTTLGLRVFSGRTQGEAALKRDHYERRAVGL